MRYTASIEKIKILQQIGLYIYFGLFIFAVLYPISPAMQKTSGRDSGVFQYVAWRLLEGDVLYRDVWDHKPPVIFILNAIGLALSGNTTWGVWFVQVIFLCLSTYLIYSIVKLQFSSQTAVLSSTLFLISLPRILDGGNLTTQYGILFQLVAIFIFISQVKITYKFLLIGMVTAFLFLTKQNIIGVGLSIGVLTAMKIFQERQNKTAIKSLTMMLLGFLGVLSLTIFIFWINGAVEDFISAAFTYNFSYLSSSFREKIEAVLHGIELLKQSGLSVLGLIGWGIAILYKHLKEINKFALAQFILICIPVELLLTGTSGRTYSHYYMALLPIFTLAAAFVFHFLQKVMRLESNSPKSYWLYTVMVICILLLHQSTYQGRSKFFPFADKKQDIRVETIISHLKTNTNTQDKVLIIGAEAYINFATQRISPTRFVYQYPLIKEGYSNDALIKEFIYDVEVKKPKYILFTDNYTLQENPPSGYDPTQFLEQVNKTMFLGKPCIQSYDIPADILGKWVLYQCTW